MCQQLVFLSKFDLRSVRAHMMVLCSHVLRCQSVQQRATRPEDSIPSNEVLGHADFADSSPRVIQYICPANCTWLLTLLLIPDPDTRSPPLTHPPPPPRADPAERARVSMRATSTILCGQACAAAVDTLGSRLATAQHETIQLWQWDTAAWTQTAAISTDSPITRVQTCVSICTASDIAEKCIVGTLTKLTGRHPPCLRSCIGHLSSMGLP